MWWWWSCNHAINLNMAEIEFWSIQSSKVQLCSHTRTHTQKHSNSWFYQKQKKMYIKSHNKTAEHSTAETTKQKKKSESTTPQNFIHPNLINADDDNVFIYLLAFFFIFFFSLSLRIHLCHAISILLFHIHSFLFIRKKRKKMCARVCVTWPVLVQVMRVIYKDRCERMRSFFIFGWEHTILEFISNR